MTENTGTINTVGASSRVLDALVRAFDTDDNGIISVDELIEALMKVRDFASRMKIAGWVYAVFMAVVAIILIMLVVKTDGYREAVANSLFNATHVILTGVEDLLP